MLTLILYKTEKHKIQLSCADKFRLSLFTQPSLLETSQAEMDALTDKLCFLKSAFQFWHHIGGEHASGIRNYVRLWTVKIRTHSEHFRSLFCFCQLLIWYSSINTDHFICHIAWLGYVNCDLVLLDIPLKSWSNKHVSMSLITCPLVILIAVFGLRVKVLML